MRALLAEDDFNLGTWLCKALAAVAIQVEWVNDGYLADQALRKLHAQGDYDVLILDAGLPGLSGEAVLRRLRALVQAAHWQVARTQQIGMQQRTFIDNMTVQLRTHLTEPGLQATLPHPPPRCMYKSNRFMKA